MGKPHLIKKDHGFKRFIALGKSLTKRPFVKVGFLESTATRADVRGKPATLTNVELARILTYGDKNLPPRPFLQAALTKRRRAWRLALGKLGRAYIASGSSIEAGLAELGAKAVENVKTAMRTIGVPDAAATLAEKSGSRVLVDSKQLIESVTFAVVIG
jgi:hypothetical protein